MDYLGRGEERESTAGLLKHYVGVYDPKTGDLQVTEARKIVVRGTVRAHDEVGEEEMPLQTVCNCSQKAH